MNLIELITTLNENKPKFCDKCGTALPHDANFCVECGVLIGRSNISSIQDSHSESNLQSKRKKLTIKKIGIVMGIFIISLVILSAIASIEAEDKNPSKYEGLTTDQISYVKYIEDQCKMGAQRTYALGGSTAEEYYTEKCNETIESSIKNAKYENTVKLSIERDDYTLCNNVDDYLLCIRDYALATNKPEICTKTEHVQESCILDIVKKYDDVKACDTLEDNTNCVIYFAAKNNDPKICESATNVESCAISVAYDLDMPIACDILSDNRSQQCKNDYMQRKKESGINYIITEDEKHWKKISGAEDYGECRSMYDSESGSSYCYWQSINPGYLSASDFFAVKINGEELACRHLSYQKSDQREIADFCNAAKAVYVKDISMCDSTGMATKDCYYGQALHNDEFTITQCDLAKDEGIFDENEVKHCSLLVAARTGDYSACENPRLSGSSKDAEGKEMASEHILNQNIQQCNGKISEYQAWKNQFS